VDDIIVFNSLTRENLRRIVDIQLHKVDKLLKDRKDQTGGHGRGQDLLMPTATIRNSERAP